MRMTELSKAAGKTSIAVDAESPAFEVHVAAAVLDIDELMQDLFLRFFLPQAQGYDEFAVIFRVT